MINMVIVCRPLRAGAGTVQGDHVRAGDALLLGTDMVKDEATLVQAYDDKDSVTAAFNLNILHRLNRQLGSQAFSNRGQAKIGTRSSPKNFRNPIGGRSEPSP
jgi:hypothetical protein